MSGGSDDTVSVSAVLPQSLLNSLIELANKRGVSANTVVQQAILNESFLDKKVSEGGTVLVESADHKIEKVNLSR